jgi:spermidine/putrescine transport system permease protein
MTTKRRWFLSLPGFAILTSMLVLPLLLQVLTSLGLAKNLSEFPRADSWRRIFESTLYLRLLYKSIWTGLVSTAIAIVIAWPAGWAISRVPKGTQKVLLGAVILPYLVSTILLIYGFFVLLAGNGPLMSVISLTNLVNADSSILYTHTSTVLMIAYEALPVLILVIYASSESIDQALIDSARSLGASRLQRFFHIILPLTMPGLLGGSALVFVPAAGSFVESQILGGPNGILLGNVISDQIRRINDPAFGAALSLMLLSGVLTTAFIFGRILKPLYRRSNVV